MVCALFIFSVLTTFVTSAQKYTTLYNFNGTDGYVPQGPLFQGKNGEFYGTTTNGGTNNLCVGDFMGCGTVFSITPDGRFTTLYNFCSEGGKLCTDGAEPIAGLIQGTDGKFYGTTSSGGAHGGGTIFSITTDGVMTIIHHFDFHNGDGTRPYAGLVQGADGKFYGTTYDGGAYLEGTVFSVTAQGSYTTLHSFFDEDGEYPAAALIQGTDGNFYGTTSIGGAGDCSVGCGTVFRINCAGKFSVLNSLSLGDGQSPVAPLVQGTDGKFYGTALYGGTGGCGGSGCGTIFSVTPSGTLTRLHSFHDVGGRNPTAGMIQGTDGNFYGTTPSGGKYYIGEIFEITSKGQLTNLASFNGADGERPYAGLIQAINGKFYGTAQFGGIYGNGTVFSISLGLEPFAEHTSETTK